MLLNLNTLPNIVSTGGATVWTKPKWSDAFTLRPDLTPVQCVWSIAPDVATAALEYRFGRVIVPGSAEYATYARITARGYWVLIRWLADDGTTIDWLGFAETPITRERYPARDTLPETGKQTIPCFGMIRALQETLIQNTVYIDPSDSAKAKRSGCTGGLFNAGQRGNRSATKRKLTTSGQQAYVFAHPNDATSTWWSTRDIVEHIATFYLPTPTSAAVDGGVPWSFQNVSVLPDWDRPVIATETNDVAGILHSLINPSKMLSFGIGCQSGSGDTPNITSVTIKPFSLLTEALTLPSGTLPANTEIIDITAMSDPMTTITIDEDSTGVVDQVVVQGPREITVCTLTAYPANGSPYEKGWTVTDQNNYEQGAKLITGFADLSISDKRTANEQYRTKGKMRDVYSLYRLKQNWDGKLNGEPLFSPNTDGSIYIPSGFGIEVLDHLPLFAEVDYSGTPASVNESSGLTKQLPQFTLRKRNTDGTIATDRIYVDRRGRLTMQEELLKSRPFQLDWQIEDLLNVRMVVKDAPQHAIAGKGFIGNLGDLDQESVFGDIYYEGWTLTIAIRGDRRPKYSIPTDDVVSTYDIVRRKIITLEDDSLSWVYLSKGAIVRHTNDQILDVTSPGGLLRNPLPILQSLCQMIAKQHTQPRRRATIRTGRRLSQMQLGSMIRNIDSATGPVDAPISEIRIESPMTENGPPSPPTQSFIASPYRADVLSLLRTPSKPQVPGSTRRKRVSRAKPDRRK